MPNLQNLKPFQKGNRANPGGRPKGIAAKAREHGDKAIEVLAKALDDRSPKIRIAAAKELLDRGYGKPITMSADVTNHLDEFTDEELDTAISTLRHALGKDDDPSGETQH